MIKSKQDLKYYLDNDCSSLHKSHLLRKWISRSEEYYLLLFMKYLRYTEYYLNKKKHLWDYVPFAWFWWNYRRLKIKTGLYIMPNTVGPGFNLVHPGFIRIGEDVRIGANCTILPMVLIGKSRPKVNTEGYIIGDNCYISAGVKIFGPVKIGNNVTIGGGAVVTKDIPDNAVVGGVPAKIIKMKEVNYDQQNERNHFLCSNR